MLTFNNEKLVTHEMSAKLCNSQLTILSNQKVMIKVM